MALTVFVGLLVLMPLMALLYGSVRSGLGATAELTLANYGDLLAPATRAAFVNSVLVGAGATIIAVVFGVTLAWILARTDAPIRGTLSFLVLVPFFLSPFISATAWSLLLSPRVGVMNVWIKNVLGLSAPPFDIYSVGGMIWVAGLSYSPYTFLFTSAALRLINPALEDTARITGSGLLGTLGRITLPLVAPAVLSGALIVFVLSMGDVGIPLVLGEPNGIRVLTTTMYEYTSQSPPDFQHGAAAGMIMVGVSAVLVALQRFALGRRRFTTVTGREYHQGAIRLGRWRYAALAACLAFVIVALVLPYSILVLAALSRFWTTQLDLTGLTLDNLTYVLGSYPVTQRALQNTVVLATVSASALLVLSLLSAYTIQRVRTSEHRVLEYLVGFPIAIPGLVLAMGLLWAWIAAPIPVYGTVWILIIGFVTRYIPYGTRILSSGLSQVHPELEEISRVTGAGWLTTLRRVLIPILGPALISSWVLTFIIVVRELNIPVLLYSFGNEVLSIVTFALWSEGMLPRLAAAGLIQTVLLALCIILFRRIFSRLDLRLG